MDLTLRPYRGQDDYWRIRQFLREVFLLNERRQRSWDVVRFDYWRWHGVENIEHLKPEEVIFLWEAPDGQIAAVLNPESMGEAFLQMHPAWSSPELEGEMLALAEERLCVQRPDGRRRLCVWVNESQAALRERLNQNGYAVRGSPEYQRRRTLEIEIPQAEPAPGYVVRPLGDGVELIERCFASGLAFHPGAIQIALDNREVSWYRNIQTAPLYRRDLDLVALAPDGSVASFCTVWFDDVTRTGVFEPVATVPAHQRKGLGKAVMCAGLRRLKKMGATLALVSSYSQPAGALYASAGFTDYELCQPWVKEV